ncbi:DHHC family palmitoyl transferase [Cryptosporidium ryanae]|uniref:DHHC family palmitoyl transferase n=1 Tax=Cryptosporidium ryanae TaxID=515981 RepID=UPI00351A414F|nr:DHHC family palmitoyl transferase [Cryptosporidium ryanae]
MNYNDNISKTDSNSCCIINEDLESDVRRKNGFQKPLIALQIMIWILFSANLFLYFIFIVPSLNFTLAILSGILCSLLGMIVFIYGWKVTSIDPGYTEEDSKIISENIELNECKVCHSLFEDHSKHCKLCNKCVPRYDHHCKWLNTCIGEKNYRHFFLMLFFVSLLLLLIIVTTITTILLQTIYDIASFYWTSRLKFWSPGVFYIVGIIILVVDLPLLVLNGHLFLLHCYLVFKGVTTYEYLTKIVIEEDETNKSESGKCNSCNTENLCHRLASTVDWIIADRKRINEKRARLREGKVNFQRNCANSYSFKRKEVELSTENQIDFEEKSISPARGSVNDI